MQFCYTHCCTKANPFSIYLIVCKIYNLTASKLPMRESRLLLVLGVVHTPVRSRELPSMVFILRKMSALLHVDRAGVSESQRLRALGLSL